MRKQHDFKVGDKLESRSGITCTVARIDPACNNVYAKDFSNYRANGDELSSPHIWKVVKSASDNATAPLAYDTADLHIYTVAPRGRYQGKTALHEVIAAGTASKAKAIVQEKAADFPAGTTYRAVVRFWDGDVTEHTFTVKKPEPKNSVEFTA